MLAVTMQRRGFKTAILDADITGPSIPKCFGIHEKAMGSDDGLFPVNTKTGIETMSINELLPDETSPVVWRGPVIAGVIKQFWSDVIWNEVDYMFVDLPPGTGDAPLTVFQSIPLDGIIIVTSPQELVSMIVSKAVEMAKMMNVPCSVSSKLQLCQVPVLRRAVQGLRRKPHRRGRGKVRPQGAR